MDKFPIFKTEHSKIRLGKNNDGGYVICNIPNITYDILLSGGVETDISFEEALIQKYPYLNCFAFDGTIETLPKQNSHIKFVRKNIGSECSEHLTDLKEYTAPYSNIFMKMDIEGGEQALFTSLDETEIHKIAQLVIEVHWESRNIVAERLKNTHYLVHFHPNNACTIDGFGMPSVFELTYIRKDLCKNAIPSNDTIPNPALDMKNVTDKPDILYRNNNFILGNKSSYSYSFSNLSGRIVKYWHD